MAVVAETTNVVQTFKDTDGVVHDIASIQSMSRNAQKSSVTMVVNDEVVIVEIAITEAINIIELLN